MAVRPSFVVVQVEGRETDVSTGPRSKKGRMRATFTVREKGDIVEGCVVSAWSDGKENHLRVYAEGKEVYRKDTEL